MGSPISPTVVKLFMEDFETKAINTSTNPQDYGEGMWMTLLSSRKQNTWISFLIISIPLTLAYSLPQDTLDQMAQCPP